MAGVPEMKPRSWYDYFLAKKNRNRFDAQQFGAMKDRETRRSAVKKLAFAAKAGNTSKQLTNRDRGSEDSRSPHSETATGSRPKYE
jgi:hypothetical protein